MSTTVTLYSNASALVREDNPDNNYSSDTQVVLKGLNTGVNERYLLVSFSQPEGDLQYKSIQSIEGYVYLTPDSSTGKGFWTEVGVLNSSFSENTATWNNQSPNTNWKMSVTLKNLTTSAAYCHNSLYSDVLANVLRHGIAVRGEMYFGSADTSRSTNKPYIVATFADEVSGVYPAYATPASGYIAKNQEHKFSWTPKSTAANTYTSIEQVSAVFRWRYSSSDAVREISLTTDKSVTLPASVFTEDTFEWQVSITANSGATRTSVWYSLSTEEALSSANIVEPKDTIIDGSEPVTLRWQHIISTGTLSTGADIQTSSDGEIWSDLTHVSGEETYHTVAAQTFAAGALMWRVRTYNTDNAPGSWSSAANVIVVSAPSTPSVSATAVPHTSITWQSEGQQAFQVMIDGEKLNAVFGVAQSYQYPEYLTDGTHVIAVRVQNRYGLWSQWGETAIDVANIEGAALTLNVEAQGGDAILSWNASDYDEFIIYRDNSKIAQTSNTNFTDIFVSSGEHTYQVRGIWNDNGNYGISQTTNADVTINSIRITDVVTKNSIDILHSVKNSQGNALSQKRNVKYVHYSGAMLPSGEIGEELDCIYRLRPVFLFTEANEATAFEQMLGKVVFIKDQFGVAMFGVLDSLEKYTNQYKSSYTASITKIAYSEVEANG